MISFMVMENLEVEAKRLAAVAEVMQVAADTQEVTDEGLSDALYFLYSSLDTHAKKLKAIRKVVQRERTQS